MFFLILLGFSLMAIVLGLVAKSRCAYAGHSGHAGKHDSCIWDTLASIGLVALIFFLFLGTVNQMANYTEQVDDLEEVTRMKNVIKIYDTKATNLAKEFGEYLAVKYPKQEKDIFEKIKPGTIDIYLVKYPEIRSHETIMALVKQLRSLRDDVYDTQIKLEGTLKKLRYRIKSPWVFIPMPGYVTDVETPPKS